MFVGAACLPDIYGFIPGLFGYSSESGSDSDSDDKGGSCTPEKEVEVRDLDTELTPVVTNEMIRCDSTQSDAFQDTEVTPVVTNEMIRPPCKRGRPRKSDFTSPPFERTISTRLSSSSNLHTQPPSLPTVLLPVSSVKGTKLDASIYDLCTLQNIKSQQRKRFDQLSFLYCTNAYISALFSIPTGREKICGGIVPMKYRTNATSIRSFYFLGSKQIVNILKEENLINKDGSSKEVFNRNIYCELEFSDSESSSDSESNSTCSDSACTGINAHFIRYSSKLRNKTKTIEGF